MFIILFFFCRLLNIDMTDTNGQFLVEDDEMLASVLEESLR